MTAFNVLVCALALLAFDQVSSAAPPYGIGGSGCGSVLVDVDHYCVPKSDCGRCSGGYGYGGYGFPGNGYGRGGCGCDNCCSDPVTEITTVSCIPVVETSVQPSCGYRYGNGGYGFSGYGNGRDGCCSDRICCDPVTEVTTVSCLPVVETSVKPSCGCGYGNGGYDGNYGYPVYGRGRCSQ